MDGRKLSVSVVIPYFNSERTIDRAIASIVAQSIMPHEVIIVDDCSDEPLRKFGHWPDYVTVVRRGRNGGGNAARNDGISAASGDVIALLDADDEWVPSKLEVQISHCMSAHSRGAEFLSFTNMYVEDVSGRRRAANKGGPPAGEPQPLEWVLAHGMELQTSTWLISATLAKKVKFDDTLRRHQDWDYLWLVGAESVEKIYVEEPLSVYHDGDLIGRVSSHTSTELSDEWIRSVSGLSRRAQHGFYARVIFHRSYRRGRVVAIGKLLLACAAGALEWRSLLGKLAWVGLPPEIYKRLKG